MGKEYDSYIEMEARADIGVDSEARQQGEVEDGYDFRKV